MVRTYKGALQEIIHTDFQLEVLDADCLFAEGPVWHAEGYYLFSDIPSNVISRIVPGRPKEVFLQHSGCSHPSSAELPYMMGSNGLAFDQQGRLLICQHGNHAVAAYSGTGVAPLITGYNGKPLNSPNDLVVDRTGRIFFSDPPYGLRDQKHNPGKYQPQAGLYCYDGGELRLFWGGFRYPNGVCLSPDQQFLYACSNESFEAAVLQFDTATLAFRQEVCREAGDGIKCDRRGNLYLCAGEGIVIVSSAGERLGVISLPSEPANCCWGGTSGNDLFITARQHIFLIRDLQKP